MALDFSVSVDKACFVGLFGFWVHALFLSLPLLSVPMQIIAWEDSSPK